MEAVWEPRAGILFPENCVEAHLAMAADRGADLRFDEPIDLWQIQQGGVRVTTSEGTYAAGHLVLCAGAWAQGLLAGLGLPLSVERQVQYWFEPVRDAPLFRSDRCPIYIWEHEPGRFFYGFPDLGEGVKVAGHHEGSSVAEPERLDREVKREEIDRMRQLVGRFLPAANGPLKSSAVCMYTNTPDGHFLLDSHPKWPQVLIASPCSGHGFKFSSAIGEVLADLVLTGTSRFDLSLFALNRFQSSRIR
jgi:sarcosine oxidase